MERQDQGRLQQGFQAKPERHGHGPRDPQRVLDQGHALSTVLLPMPITVVCCARLGGIFSCFACHSSVWSLAPGDRCAREKEVDQARSSEHILRSGWPSVTAALRGVTALLQVLAKRCPPGW